MSVYVICLCNQTRAHPKLLTRTKKKSEKYNNNNSEYIMTTRDIYIETGKHR